MANNAVLDIAHLGFLELIRALISQSGAANAKGTLIRLALKMGARLPEGQYASFEELVTEAAAGTCPLSYIEGPETHAGDGIFLLETCPFASSLADYQAVFDGLPDGFGQLTAEFNKPAAMTDEHRLGNGSAVSPFCALHQPMRAAAQKRITVGGKPIVLHHLGARSFDGKKALSQRWIEEAGRRAPDIDKFLDSTMCCVSVKVQG